MGQFVWTSPLFRTAVSPWQQWPYHLGFSRGVFQGRTDSHSWFNIFGLLLRTSAAQMSGAVRQVCVHLLSYSGVHAAFYKYSSVYTYFWSYSFLVILLSLSSLQPVDDGCLRYRTAHDEAQKPAFFIFYIRVDAWFGRSDTTLVFKWILWSLETRKTNILTGFSPVLSNMIHRVHKFISNL